ncbi:MAG: hypothetical protein IIB04_05240 [Acidobacteria bacterium]|nr:hypothetical protein [Acidobacteriota bacterium]
MCGRPNELMRTAGIDRTQSLPPGRGSNPSRPKRGTRAGHCSQRLTGMTT